MNELPEELVTLPIPLVGLIGISNLHFYIEKNISTRSIVDFQRLHPVSPIATSSQQQQSHISLDPLSPKLVSADTPISSSPSNQSRIEQQLNNDLLISTPNNSGSPALQQQQHSQSQSSSPNSSTTNTVSGWRVQLLQPPIIKVVSIEVGGLTNKKEKKPNHSESFIPQGVIKANWIHKHTASLPSVVSLFLQWPEDKSPKSHDALLSQIDAVKANIKQRNVKLMIVIVTNSSNVDVYDERFSMIRRRADIDPKYIIFLNKSEMKIFVKKWEKLALELTDLHYKEECQSSKSQIAKSTHPFLVIRYHFKIAFYSEFRNDMNSSLKYYTFAYNSLKDWKPNNDPRGSRFEELRMIASFLNFKICKFYLWSNNSNEALQQFERHIRLFKIYHGPDEKQFGHYQWIAREYQIFAELLEMCTNTNRNAIPGGSIFYYQTAAKYTEERRKYFKWVSDKYSNSTSVQKFKDSKPRFNLTTGCIYIGQPPPDLSHPLDHSTPAMVGVLHDDEMDDFYRSISIELQTNYTNLIVDLLGRAFEQATIHRNTRIISFIESLIANEYFIDHQYDMALQYFNHNALTYRREKWWMLLTYTLSMCLKCVHNLNQPTSYIGYAMDLLSPDLTNSKKERSIIQQFLLYVLVDSSKLSPPISLTAPLDVKMDHTHPLINCRVQFPHSIATSHSKTEFFVVIESHFPDPIRFSKLRAVFSDPSYNKVLNGDQLSIVDPISPTLKMNQERKDLVFLPNESRLFSFTLATKEKMELECQSVILELGSSPSVNFCWNISEWAIKSDQESSDKDQHNQQPQVKKNQVTLQQQQQQQQQQLVKPDPYKKFLERSSIRILDHESLIQIKCNHTPPAIINEFYEIELELVNNDKEITKGTITFELLNPNIATNQQQQQQQQTELLLPTIEINNKPLVSSPSITQIHQTQQQAERGIYPKPSFSEQLSTLSLPHIQEKASFKKIFYLHSSQIDENRLVINVSYETKSNEISHSSKGFNFPVQIGFLTQFQFFSTNFTPNDMYDGAIVAKEPLLLLCDIRMNLPYDVVIDKTTLKINNVSQATLNPLMMGASDESGAPNDASSVPVGHLLSSSNSNLSPSTLTRDGNYSCWFNLIPLITGESLSLGSLTIYWRRKVKGNDQDDKSIVSQLPILLPHMRITTNPFITNVNVPSYGVVGVPLAHSIVITNNTNFLQEFELLVTNPASYGGSDAPFLFAGDRVGTFSIHPESTHEIRHVLLPLVAGKHPLPHFKITSKRFNKELPKTKNTNEFLFVKPFLSN
ncbi:DUF1683 family protein [Cavenderia fasciculata]|uniref:DUF1683 family protein n=1 Tax=Cavenderia fasciculata TaxID=261658 RepID=F4QBU9_CACFS|nr:DUF1683 family protein [Cavenderia fasciculata]EGG14687.1 DUF1683 family protein [Cavenderia fasciculata]|eukprot:XP_004351195.1 DUF1683 family protein [Cavenderia fasciculata]